jgi:hypothetical protein
LFEHECDTIQREHVWRQSNRRKYFELGRWRHGHQQVIYGQHAAVRRDFDHSRHDLDRGIFG